MVLLVLPFASGSNVVQPAVMCSYLKHRYHPDPCLVLQSVMQWTSCSSDVSSLLTSAHTFLDFVIIASWTTCNFLCSADLAKPQWMVMGHGVTSPTHGCSGRERHMFCLPHFANWWPPCPRMALALIPHAELWLSVLRSVLLCDPITGLFRCTSLTVLWTSGKQKNKRAGSSERKHKSYNLI